MALPPKFAGHKLQRYDTRSTPHTVELYLDYVCPFSAKLFNTLYGNGFSDSESVIETAMDETSPYHRNVVFIFRQHIQPWHPSSTLVHEAGLAVLSMTDDPEKFWDFSAELFRRQKEYFDVSVVNQPRNDTYQRLSALAASSVGVDKKEMYNLLRVAETPAEDGALNTGNGVTGDVKTITKMGRLTGVHVTPTVLFDGVEAKEISSSWTRQQWLEWLQKNCSY